MAKDFEYSADPSMKDSPLRFDEVELYILQGVKSFKESKNIIHLLSRMLATLREQRNQNQEYLKSIDQIRSQLLVENEPFKIVAKNLPLLTKEEGKSLLDRGYLSALEDLESTKERVLRTQLAVQSEGNRIKLILNKVYNDPDLPEHLKDLLKPLF